MTRVIEIFKSLGSLIENMLQIVVRHVSDAVAYVNSKITRVRYLVVHVLACMVITQLSIAGIMFGPVVGGVAVGSIAGIAIAEAFFRERDSGDIQINDTERVVETEVVPYDEWPSDCYSCGKDIEKSMEVRGQFVVHKGQSEAETKAVGVCESCVWTYGTLFDNADELTRIYDHRGDPVEL